MQRLFLAALLLAIAAGVVAALAVGLRETYREVQVIPRESEGSRVQKLAFVALVLLIAGVSSGLLGGL
jgi:hypothetical protein